MRSSWYSRERTAWCVLGVFALVLGLITFPNHYLLRTHAMDLGLYTHVLWQYAHGHMHDSTLFLEHAQPILADHFDLYLVLFSPLVYVFGTWTLLVLQWFSMLVGAWGVRRLLLAMHRSEGMALLGMTIFLLFFGLYAAISYDYHSNVAGTMVLPWFILALIQGRKWLSFLLLVLILMAKENMGMWIGWVAFACCFLPELPKRMRSSTALFGVFAMAWSLTLMGWVMPALSTGERYMHFDYTLLGEGIRDVPRAFIERPVEILKAFFVDHRGEFQGTQVKLEFWWMMLLSGGWAFFLRPRWGIMVLPLLAMKMLHDHIGKWSAGAQYSIEFAPLTAIAVVLVVSEVSQAKWRTGLCVVALVASLATTMRLMDNTYVKQLYSRIRFYQANHYSSSYDVRIAHQVMSRIPSSASVSAQTSALPHLALCERVYLFPIIRDADHIVLLPSDERYPLNWDDYDLKVEELMNDSTWQLVENTEEVVHFVRRAPGQSLNPKLK